MAELRVWRRRFTGATCVLLGLIGSSTAGFAGTGRLLSQWMTRAPQIDGRISAGEWDATTPVDMGDGVSVRFGNDGRTLYVAVLSSTDLTYDFGDSLALVFDDEGGVAPVLDDGQFESTSCHWPPYLHEGVLYFGDQTVDFQEVTWPWNAVCPNQYLSDRVSFRGAGWPEGVTYEAAIPLDGSSPLQARPGERFGILMFTRDGGSRVGCLPSCEPNVPSPPEYRNLVLASGGCNTGPQDFGPGSSPAGLPLDWTGVLTNGVGQGWNPSSLGGDPVFCNDNVTGGSGAAACVANVLGDSRRVDAVLRMPLSLAGQASATIRSRALLRVDPNGGGPLEYLSFDVRHQDGTSEPVLFWSGQDQDQSGLVDLPLPLGGSPLVELSVTHSTLSGELAGGFAQVDDVELLCGPALFADDFESGLATHWSSNTADTP